MDIVCPHCHKDDAIQKVSAVVAGGRASGSFLGHSGGSVNIDGKWGSTSGYTTLGGISASDLAQTLAPPPDPMKQSEGMYSSGCIIGLLAVPFACTCTALIYAVPATFLLEFDSASARIGYISSLVVGIIFVGFCLWLFWILRKDAFKEKDRRTKEIESKYVAEKLSWENAMAKWNLLYYCHRDGIIFNPENGDTWQPTQIQKIVYE